MAHSALAVDTVEVQLELDRILRSHVFEKAQRSQRFLRYIVENSLGEPPVPVKEYTVALEVFERDASYDPSVDATVRVEASRLRTRLREYYADEGLADSILIEVPKGGYTPVFSLREPPAFYRRSSDQAVASPDPDRAVSSTPAEQPPIPAANRPALLLPAVAVLVSLLILGLAWNVWQSRFAGRSTQTHVRSLAVLPLDNLSGDPGQEYFADGLTDELITMLAKNSTLRITSRTSVMQYKGVHRPLRDIARELGVDGVLEGSVARSGDKVHMTIQLIQASDDKHLWAESYDTGLSDLMSLPRTAARTIARQLNSTVAEPAATRFVRPEAHDAYLHGRYLWFLDNNDKAGEYFRKATDLQPDYALGWSGLAIFYGAGAVEGQLDPTQALAPAKEAALKAIELDESLPEAHLALSSAIFLHDWNWPRSEAEIARAIELDPKFAEAYHFHAKMLAALNRHGEAIEAQRKATELDPFARPWAMALSLVLARQYDAALTDARQRLESNPTDATLHWMLYNIYRSKGMYTEAVAMLEQQLLLANDKSSAASVRRAFEQGGYKAVLAWQIAHLEQRAASHYVSPVELAALYAQLGRREKTLALLEEAYRQHAPGLLWIQANPAFDFLHADERYRSVIAGLKLPPAPL